MTSMQTFSSGRTIVKGIRTFGAAAALFALGACASKDLQITNPNVVSVDGAAGDPQAVQLLATGVLNDFRGSRAGYISETCRFGRECYSFPPQEGRNTTHYLIGITVNGQQALDPSGFAVGEWGTQYNALRDIYNFKKTTSTATSLSTAQKAAALGFAQTLEAEELFEVISTRDTLGAIVEIKDVASTLAPFVSRDSVYKYILATLDAGATSLAAGGAAFPFSLHSGFAGFNTPTTFVQFNRALKARAAAHYATLGGGATAWAASLAANAASFLNAGATTAAAFNAGPFQPYGPAPDSPNGLNQVNNTDLYAHTSLLADAQLKADGTPDNRYATKVRTGLPSRQGPIANGGPTSGSSTLGFSIWPNNAAPIPIIRNEELILLRAEAKLGTGDKAGAIADLNIVRTNSGGLPASTLTAASSNDDIVNGLLYEKRYSLLMEGHRWIDARRYGKLSTIPLDIPSGPNKNFVAKVMPIPQGECLVRANATGALRGPNGQDNCK
jgi:hypothetical protein